jgi:hypothetical protein
MGIVELNGENGELMLGSQRAQHRQMTASNGIVAGNPVIEDGDAQTSVSPRKWALERVTHSLFIGRIVPVTVASIG